MSSAIARRAALALLAVASLNAGATAAKDDSEASKRPPPRFDPLLAPFMHPPTFSTMVLSPDGQHLAGVGYNPVGSNSGVVMIDTATLEANLIVEPKVWVTRKYRPYVRNPRSIQWLDDQRLAVNFTMPDGAIFGLDGTPGPDLMQGYVHPLRDGAGKPTDWHLVMRDRSRFEMARLNIITGKDTSYDLDVRGKLFDWASDPSGEIRVAQTYDTAFWSDTSRVQTWYRQSVDAAWEKIDDRSVTDDPFRPLFVPNRPNRIVVQARNGGDRLAVWDYDVEKHAFVELLAGHESEDIVSVLSDDLSSEFKDIVTDGLKRHHYWFDERFAHLQSSIDASLPDRINVLQRTQASNVLVYSYSDVDPGRWYVLESKTMKMREVAARIPQIDPKRMQPMQTLHYPAPDGLSIPAYLTLPGKPDKPAPLVVLIHGGPQARDRWAFDSEVQILAAHGYAVFQPQFRGSRGFGKRFEEAGYGQWGKAMQDDVTAGVHWLIDQKIADPQRICIVGASYGGYAALWGLEKTPELYKCGASVAGVSDLERMLRDDSDMSRNAISREMVRQELGDPAKVHFDEVSPLRHADRIQVPVLLVHGNLDQRVPISHGKKMRDALKDGGKDVQWIEFADEGHGVVRPENRRVYYDALFALLARTIGKGEPPAPIAAVASPEIPLEPVTPAASAPSATKAPGPTSNADSVVRTITN